MGSALLRCSGGGMLLLPRPLLVLMVSWGMGGGERRV